MPERTDYYVYVYIDPRNFEEFYYGKGCRGRKEEHLFQIGDSSKHARIKAIRKENEEPIIRVIAKGLTQDQALLVETTLIWRQAHYLTNLAQGHYSTHFRPANRMHVKLPEFDFHNSIYYGNISEGATRSWEDCQKYGFLAAGGGRNWSEQLDRLNPGDIVAAYCAGSGFVGVGRVIARSVRVKQFRFQGLPLKPADLIQPNIFADADDPDRSHYLVPIEWKRTVPRAEAKFKSKWGLYTPQRVVASLGNQPITRKFIENSFDVSLNALAEGS